MMIAAAQLALNDISPSPATLGTLNALALAFSSGIRAWSPALFTTLFAIGVRNHILYGQLIWVIVIIIASVLAISLYWLPEKVEGKYRTKKNNDAERNGNGVGGENEIQEEEEEQNGHLER
jgi:membrane protein implicated in regulation of membrane protease activity